MIIFVSLRRFFIMNNISITTLIRSRRRTVALIITPEAGLTVRAPLHTPIERIEQFVREKDAWIRRKINQVSARPRPLRREFIDGSSFLYCGRECRFEIYDGEAISCTETLLFPRALLSQAREEMLFWYRQEARRVVTERVRYYAEKMNLEYRAIALSNADTRWGSCSPTDGLRFNWRLIMVPPEALDYVVVHELAHVIVRNHSWRFWDKVREFFPAYIAARRWLKQNCRLMEYE